MNFLATYPAAALGDSITKKKRRWMGRGQLEVPDKTYHYGNSVITCEIINLMVLSLHVECNLHESRDVQLVHHSISKVQDTIYQYFINICGKKERKGVKNKEELLPQGLCPPTSVLPPTRSSVGPSPGIYSPPSSENPSLLSSPLCWGLPVSRSYRRTASALSHVGSKIFSVVPSVRLAYLSIGPLGTRHSSHWTRQ